VLCDSRTAFVFWDAYHTSDAANQVIADRLYADMVSASAVQGNGNATTASTRAPRVVVDGGTPRRLQSLEVQTTDRSAAVRRHNAVAFSIRRR
jgi:hypothetical protein